MSRVLVARSRVAGRPCTLAVGLHALGVRLGHPPALPLDHAVVVHPPIRTAAEAQSAIDVARALAH